jgi:hypothetical protein
MDILLIGTGLLVSGYWINKKTKNPRFYNIRKKLSENEEPAGDHIYSSTEIEKQKTKLQEVMNSRYSDSLEENSNLITYNNTKLRENIDATITTILPQKQVISSLTDSPMEMFIPNNTPYYSGNIGEEDLGVNYQDISKLSTEDFNLKPKKKKEVLSLFKPEIQNSSSKLETLNNSRDRYEVSGNKSGINPFLEVKEKPLFTSKAINPGDIPLIYRKNPKMIEDLRVNERPVLKNITQMGAFVLNGAGPGEFNKNQPETFHKRENSLLFRTGPVTKIKTDGDFSTFKNKLTENFVGIQTSKNKKPANNDAENRKKEKLVDIRNNSNVSLKVYKESPFVFRSGYTPAKTIRNENHSNYTGNIKAVTSDIKYAETEPIRENRQIVNTGSVSQINGSSKGAYSQHENFKQKVSIKQLNIENKYSAPADSLKKDGAYLGAEVQLRHTNNEQVSYTPGAKSNHKFIGIDETGTNRNVNRTLVENYLNSGSFSLNSTNTNNFLKTNNKTSKKAVEDNNRFFQDAQFIPNQLESAGDTNVRKN